MTADLITIAREAYPEGCCIVRHPDGHYIPDAWCAGLDEIRQATEQGIIHGVAGYVRYTAKSEIQAIQPGAKVEIKRAGDTNPITVRADLRHQTGQAVRLQITPQYQEQ